MFLRNLEILSGMKLNICSLLLILSALFCISAGHQNTKFCKRNPVPTICNVLTGKLNSAQYNGNGVEKNIFILGTDGFLGYMKKGDCRNISQDQSAILCNSSGLSEERKLYNITVFTFEESNATSTNDSVLGFSLSKQSPYELNISRSITQDQCLIEGFCKSYTWIGWIAAEVCNWTLPKTFGNTTCNMTCLNPTLACKTATYNPNCRDDNAGDESNMNTIELYNKSATCLKCGSPFQKLDEIQNISSSMLNLFNNSKKGTDAGAAAVAMKNLTDLVSSMGNLTVATISLGSVKGVLKKIKNELDITTSAFIYSSETGIRVIEDSTVMKDYPNAFTIPKEASLQAFNKSAEKAFLGLFRFPNMTKDENNSTVLGNEVYAIEMGTGISNLTENISLAFSKTQNMIGTPVCNSWDGTGKKPNWTTEGCTTVLDGNKITCNCSHLTFFAVLMADPNDIPISQNDLVTLTYITYIGCGLSMFFLGVALFIHFLLRKSKATNSAHVLMNLFLALFLLNLTFLTNEYVASANNHNACKVMAGFMHYCLLASFSWFAVEALHLCLQMAKHSVDIKHYILKISVVGWVPPAIVVSIIFVLGKYGEQNIKTESSNVTMCWILDSTVHYVVNIGYYCFVFIFTSSTCIVVLRWLSMLKVSKLKGSGKVKRSGTASCDITTILGLCCLLGLTWSFTFFSFGSLRVPSYYIFTILNSFQGLFLFIYYVKTSTLFGDSVPSEESNVTEDTHTENPYDDELPTHAKKDT